MNSFGISQEARQELKRELEETRNEIEKIKQRHKERVECIKAEDKIKRELAKINLTPEDLELLKQLKQERDNESRERITRVS